jgi:3-oxoacid CoA-transferase subunit B
VDLVITDLAVLAPDREAEAFRLLEIAPGVTREEVVAATAAPVLDAEA